MSQLVEQRTNELDIDLDSPIAKILNDLKILQSESSIDMANKLKISNILAALSNLDANLFTPDIGTQMNSKSGVDDDTKSWAMSVLTNNGYSRGKRQTAANLNNHSTTSDSSSSNSHGPSLLNESDALLPEVVPLDEILLIEVRKQIVRDGWNLNTLAIGKTTNNKPLYYVVSALFDIHSIFDKIKLKKSILFNFIWTLEEGYMDNPYHNSCHAADVTNGVAHIIANLSNGRMMSVLTPNEFFASLIAAALHDFQHPGRTNAYLSKTSDDWALQYSDSSVLERMHLAEAFFLTKQKSCNIFAGFKDKQYREVRKAIIEMVLCTDLANHLSFVGSLQKSVMSDQGEGHKNDPIMIMKVALKCADIGHSTKTRALHGKWSELIIEEFFLQGDKERELGLTISPFMDRTNENSAKNQIGFFEFIVLPFFETVAESMFDEDFKSILDDLHSNYRLWKLAAKQNMTEISIIQDQMFAS